MRFSNCYSIAYLNIYCKVFCLFFVGSYIKVIFPVLFSLCLAKRLLLADHILTEEMCEKDIEKTVEMI